MFVVSKNKKSEHPLPRRNISDLKYIKTLPFNHHERDLLLFFPSFSFCRALMVVKVFLDLINYLLCCCSQLIKNKNKMTPQHFAVFCPKKQQK